jgi:toxin-antitoxin system PIN domain toxin
MTIHLLDANVLIALTVAEHEHHERASRWASGVESFALCPIVEGALVRFLLRIGETPAVATEVLRGVQARPGYAFWPDAVSYADIALDHVRGHRQVTDAYLVGLVTDHAGARLATLDAGLAQVSPDLAVLLPAP